MIELKKDLFECISEKDTDTICITTNGHYTPYGAIMGGGCAKIASERWPSISVRLGKMLEASGTNIPFVIGAIDKNGNSLELSKSLIDKKQYKCLIFSFPTIDNLMDGGNLELIKRSSSIMMDFADKYNLKRIICGRPGAGIAGLLWSDVKSAIENILDDRFVIVSFQHES